MENVFTGAQKDKYKAIQWSMVFKVKMWENVEDEWHTL